MTTLDALNADRYVSSIDDTTRIDLSGVDFVLPGGSVAIACAAHAAQEGGDRLDVTGPNDDEVARYASRMGLGDIFATCGAPNVLPSVRQNDHRRALVECQWADDNVIEGLAGMVNGRLWDAGVNARITDALTVVIYEIANNVKTHARSGGGFICAQTYQRGTPSERIEVAVGDTGCGVRASLETRHSPSNDEHALVLATEESVTGLPGRPRGLGLHYAVRDTCGVGGRLILRSGAAYLGATPGRRFSARCKPIVGTLVEIRVPVGGLTKGDS